MRISVDFTAGIGDPTGVGTYTRELVRALLALPGGPDLTLAVHAFRHPGWHAKVRAAAGSARGYRVAVNRLIPHGLLLRTEPLLGAPTAEDLFGPADVFHGTNFLIPPLRRARGVVTVHDLAFVRFADEIPVAHRYARHIGSSIRRAARILCVSEATKRDVLELFPVSPEKVAVVPEGGPTEFPVAPDDRFQSWGRRIGLPERYVLFVGTLEPRKNLVRLVRAFLRARSALPRGTGLVLAGRPGWHAEELRAEIRAASRVAPVIRTGFVSTPLRNALLDRALVFALPSRYEGFGLPVLEAFRAGTPVVAGDAGALPETAGDAARLVPPEDEGALADALVELATDAGLREELVRRGRKRLGSFSWETTAKMTREVYDRA